MQLRLRDPFSGITHFVGAFFGLIALVYLVEKSLRVGTSWHVVSFAIFGASLILLYSSSAFYHMLNVSDATRLILRRIDHSMIFILIAGTYTPFCLVPLRGPWGWSIFITVWTLTIAGILMSAFWIHAPRWLSTGLYLFIGWIAIAAIYPLYLTLTTEALVWLVIGGLFYSVGAVIYAKKWPDPFPPTFGFHEIWHLFVLAGSFSHFLSVNTILAG